MSEHNISLGDGSVPDRWQGLHSMPVSSVTKEQLKQIASSVTEKALDLFLPYINKYAEQYEVNTTLRMSAFLAQVMHESGCFKYTREIWGPTADQRRYERDFKMPWGKQLKRGDRNYKAYILGNSQPGDGRFFAGHGLIQITGRTNHERCSMALFGDKRLLTHPELITTPEYAVQSAFWYWSVHNINAKADTPGIVDDTKAVNGGVNGLAARQQLFDRAVEVLAA